MSRSVWKGPFVDMYLMKKAETVKTSGRNDVIKTWSRRSTIMPQFVGLTFDPVIAFPIFSTIPLSLGTPSNIK